MVTLWLCGLVATCRTPASSPLVGPAQPDSVNSKSWLCLPTNWHYDLHIAHRHYNLTGDTHDSAHCQARKQASLAAHRHQMCAATLAAVRHMRNRARITTQGTSCRRMAYGYAAHTAQNAWGR